MVTTTAVAFKVLPIAAQHPASSTWRARCPARARSTGRVLRGDRHAGQGRGSALATVAALLGGLGAFCGAIVNVLVAPTSPPPPRRMYHAARPRSFLVTAFNSEFGHVFLYLYFAAAYVAPLLMGIALWRSRTVPRWLAALFFVGLEVAEQMESAGPIVVLYMLPFAAAMVLLAARIWQAAAEPASQRRLPPEPASVRASLPATHLRSPGPPERPAWKQRTITNDRAIFPQAGPSARGETGRTGHGALRELRG